MKKANNSQALQIQCDEHPKYASKRAPKTDCIVCWKVYALALELKLREIQKNTKSKK